MIRNSMEKQITICCLAIVFFLLPVTIPLFAAVYNQVIILYDIFWKFGPVRQIRRGITNKNKGTCFVVYDDIFDAKKAVDRLSGFNVAGKYLVCFYYNPNKNKKMFN